MFYFLGIGLAYIGKKVIEENFDAEMAAIEAGGQLPEQSSQQADMDDIETVAEADLTTAAAS